jgi:WD40 repeat protein
MIKFHEATQTIVTAGGSSGLTRIWDYASGKCEADLRLSGGDDTGCGVTPKHDEEGSAHVLCLILLDPYPLIVTSDSLGNITIWGSRCTYWAGSRLCAFNNVTAVHCEVEARIRVHDSEDEIPRRCIVEPTISDKVVTAAVVLL